METAFGFDREYINLQVRLVRVLRGLSVHNRELPKLRCSQVQTLTSDPPTWVGPTHVLYIYISI